jgi:hypothetical protein
MLNGVFEIYWIIFGFFLIAGIIGVLYLENNSKIAAKE